MHAWDQLDHHVRVTRGCNVIPCLENTFYTCHRHDDTQCIPHSSLLHAGWPGCMHCCAWSHARVSRYTHAAPLAFDQQLPLSWHPCPCPRTDVTQQCTAAASCHATTCAPEPKKPLPPHPGQLSEAPPCYTSYACHSLSRQPATCPSVTNRQPLVLPHQGFFITTTMRYASSCDSPTPCAMSP
jgi:hypothetical protein